VLVVEGSLTQDEFLVLYGRHGAFHAAFASGHARSLRGYRKLLARGAPWDDALEMARVANPDLAAPRP
jgi:3-phenylpropionate/trans-cinnamate dioxygenase ferredoxin reductase subunit